MLEEPRKALIRRFYAEIWNAWNFALVDELLAADVRFRGSFGVTVHGREGFRDYMRTVRAAFPDFDNRVDGLIAEGDEVVARLTYRGTHRGELFGVAPTGRVVTYPGIAIFQVADGQIRSGWVVGDTLSVVRQIGAFPMAGPPETA